MYTLYCQDIQRVFKFDCCGSCHDEWEYGYGYEREVEPDDNKNGVQSTVRAFVCCAAPKSLSRNDFAKIVKAKRKDNK